MRPKEITLQQKQYANISLLPSTSRIEINQWEPVRTSDRLSSRTESTESKEILSFDKIPVDDVTYTEAPSLESKDETKKPSATGNTITSAGSGETHQDSRESTEKRFWGVSKKAWIGIVVAIVVVIAVIFICRRKKQ